MNAGGGAEGLLLDWAHLLQVLTLSVLGYAGWWLKEATKEMRRLREEMAQFRTTISVLEGWTKSHDDKDTERHQELKTEVQWLRDRLVMRHTNGS